MQSIKREGRGEAALRPESARLPLPMSLGQRPTSGHVEKAITQTYNCSSISLYFRLNSQKSNFTVVGL